MEMKPIEKQLEEFNACLLEFLKAIKELSLHLRELSFHLREVSTLSANILSSQVEKKEELDFSNGKSIEQGI